jgi:hypothetical protein
MYFLQSGPIILSATKYLLLLRETVNNLWTIYEMYLMQIKSWRET